MPLLKDAREAVDRLREGGVPEEQANAIVDLFVDADEQVATQSDVERLEAQMEAMEERILRTLSFRLFAATGVLAAPLAIFEFTV